MLHTLQKSPLAPDLLGALPPAASPPARRPLQMVVPRGGASLRGASRKLPTGETSMSHSHFGPSTCGEVLGTVVVCGLASRVGAPAPTPKEFGDRPLRCSGSFAGLAKSVGILLMATVDETHGLMAEQRQQ